MDWYTISNINELDTPALVVYPERVRENIRRAIDLVGDPARLRPHVKTHKSPQVTRMMLEAGIQKFKCATIAEAEMLALEGAPDVLLAYQPIGPKVKRLTALIQKFPSTKFSCLIDSPDAAQAMADVFDAAGLVVPVWLDINVGMDRTGISPGAGALALYREAMEMEGIDPIGLHAYDGHIRDSDPVARAKHCDAAFETVLALRKETIGTTERWWVPVPEPRRSSRAVHRPSRSMPAGLRKFSAAQAHLSTGTRAMATSSPTNPLNRRPWSLRG